MVIKVFLIVGLRLLLAGCSGTPAATPTLTPAPPAFEVSVTSADASMNFTATSFVAQRDVENGVVSITFSAADGQSVQVFFEPAAEPGNVTLVASTDAMNPQRQPLNGAWLLVQAANTASGAEPVYYSKDPAGTFTLTSRADGLSGVFEVTLANLDGLTVTVVGNFSDIGV